MTEKNRTIVVVDDDSVQALLVAEFLIGHGFKVEIASTGLSGLQKIQEIQPHLVVLDLVLPDISGADVCSRLRNDRNTQYIPIILCSATKISPEDRVQGFRSGADDYLVRPFELAELLARIEAMLRRAAVQPKADMLTGLQQMLSKPHELKPASLPSRPVVPLSNTVAAMPAAETVHARRPPSHVLKKIWDLLNHPARALRSIDEREEFFIAIAMVAGTPVLGSFVKLFQRGGGFDGWVGGFALGLVVHLVLWFVVAFILQMALPFLGVHFPIKRVLGLAGLAWAPRFIFSALSVAYAGISSMALAGVPAAFTAYGLFDAWSAWILIVGIWTAAPLARPRWNSVVIVVGISCFLIGALFRF